MRSSFRNVQEEDNQDFSSQSAQKRFKIFVLFFAILWWNLEWKVFWKIFESQNLERDFDAPGEEDFMFGR